MKRILKGVATAGIIALAVTGITAGSSSAASKKLIVVGFAQTGSESGWRAANTLSMKAAFSKANGFKLIFNAADNKPENQIAAVHSFINQHVNAIVFSAVVTTGWANVLAQAKAAKIPVILEDRTISAAPSLYATWLGDNFLKEGTTAGLWAKKMVGTTPTNMVVLEGTTGSSPAIDRAKGFNAAIAGSPITLLDSQTGNFTRAGGKTVMEGFLQKYGKTINLLFAQNDDMGLGALDAIKAAGLTPGKDIKIVSIDGTHDGLTALAQGEFNYVVECNPLLGPGVAKLVKAVLAGKKVAKANTAVDLAFTQAQAIAALPTRKY